MDEIGRHYIKIVLLGAIILFGAPLQAVCAQGAADSVADKKPSRFKAYWKDYGRSLIHGNIDRTFERKMDFTWIIAPCYTNEGSVGIGGALVGLYRIDRSDSLLQPSNLQLTGSAMIRGFYSLSLSGNNHFRTRGRKSLLSYDLNLSRKTLRFWGINREACAQNSQSAYLRQQAKLVADYTVQFPYHVKLGAGAVLNYTEATKMKNPLYLEGQKPHYFFTGLSGTVQYDSRDFIPTPTRGFFAMLKATLYPEFLSTYHRTLFSLTAQFNAYHALGKTTVVACDLQGIFNPPATPWVLREELGRGSSRWRGYYAGRYIDNNLLTAQIEIRQHIFWRIGAVAWAGGGYIFPSFKAFNPKEFMYNYGLGLRFEIKHRVNMRIDCGFGQKTYGFSLQMTEAF